MWLWYDFMVMFFFNEIFILMKLWEKNDKYIFELKSKNGQTIKSKRLAHSTKLDYKKTLRKFYKWLLGNNKYYPELVDWIDTYDVIKEIPALKREEVEKIADSLKNNSYGKYLSR